LCESTTNILAGLVFVQAHLTLQQHSHCSVKNDWLDECRHNKPSVMDQV